jgi:hypothetical protein
LVPGGEEIELEEAASSTATITFPPTKKSSKFENE